MIIQKKSSPLIWQFDSFSREKGIRHFVSTRASGVSQEQFSSLNLSFSVGDLEENVWENRKRLAQSIQIPPSRLCFSNQVHGNKVRYISENEIKDSEILKNHLKETDATFTDVKGLCLCTMAADCVPVLFYVPQKQVIGVAHAGWRGTVGKIAQKTALAIIQKYQCNPSEILVGIAPSISSEAYEIGKEVIEAVEKAFGTKEGLILNERKNEGKAYFDLWEANKRQLLEIGIPSVNIEISGICTFQNSDTFFSARKNFGGGGRFAAGLYLL
ncbi:MAG: peptidoglycan editing factor PgeF [Flammeovirgaceae bacterium]